MCGGGGGGGRACVRACVRARACVCAVDEMNLKYALHWLIQIEFIPYYTSATHKYTHARILKPFEDSEPTGLKVDIAKITLTK